MAEYHYRANFTRSELIDWARDWGWPGDGKWKHADLIVYLRLNEWLFGETEAAD